jgi:ribosome maturation protein Sdo1
MPAVELVYTSSDDTPVTFCMMVNSDDYQKYSKGDTSIPIAQIFNSFDVFKFEGKGKEGIMSRPSNTELKNTFETTNDMALAEFFLKNGTIHGTMPRADARKSGEEQGVFKNEPVTFQPNYHS